MIVSTSQIFNPVTKEIRLATATNIARSSHTANTLKDGTILVTGGLSNRARFLFSAEIFTPPETVEVPAFVEVAPEPTPAVLDVAPTPAPVVTPATSDDVQPPSAGACSATGGRGVDAAHVALMLVPLGLVMRRLRWSIWTDYFALSAR
jgi:hypothetical protein